jgi:hypothetical protein
LAGYAVAVLAANTAVAVQIAHTSGPEADASAGMFAFGDGLLFIAVFSALAILTTGLAFWFLRPDRWFWIALSKTALAIASTAVLSAVVYVVAAHLVFPRESPFAMWAAFAVLRMLLSPSLAAASDLLPRIRRTDNIHKSFSPASSVVDRTWRSAAAGGAGTTVLRDSVIIVAEEEVPRVAMSQ